MNDMKPDTSKQDTKETRSIDCVDLWFQTVPKRVTDKYRVLKFLEIGIVTNDKMKRRIDELYSIV